MSTALKATLEKAIQTWADKQAEDDENGWSTMMNDVYWPDTLVAQMAEAAYQIMKANRDGQLFAKEQEPS
jgi:hypothetical protein